MERRKFIKKSSAIVGLTAVGGSLVVGSGMYDAKSKRKVHRILSSHRVNVGTLPVMRAFAGDQNDFVSPYVLFDEFGPVSINPGTDALKVEAHPHAGVSPTSYFLEGAGHHKDSLNYDFQIGKGDFMMFNSGRGAIHMEESGKEVIENGGLVHGFQVWLNTPSQYKFMDPATTVNNGGDMGAIETKDYKIQVVLGELFGKKSQIETLSPAFYYHVKMNENTRLDIPTNPTDNAFIYMIRGELELESAKALKKNQVVLYERGESYINLFAKEGAEFMVLGGKPLDEIVFSYGPFVMNTEQQIRQCMQNYQRGLMGNPELVNLSN